MIRTEFMNLRYTGTFSVNWINLKSRNLNYRLYDKGSQYTSGIIYFISYTYLKYLRFLKLLSIIIIIVKVYRSNVTLSLLNL